MQEEYKTRDLTQEEAEALTNDMKEVLEKHNAEMSVVSTIQLLKRIETNGDNTTEETTKTN